MTDDERLPRLTKLARAVYGEDVVVHCYCEPTEAWSVRRAEHIVAFIEGPTDALEAALLVLADEERVPLTADQVTRDALESCRRGREALLRRLQEERAAMAELAEQWEREAMEETPEVCKNAHPPYLLRITLQECARELRARLKPSSPQG